jgi:tyrosinase
MRTRKGVSTVEAAADIATYAEGVRIMKQRSDVDRMDPLGWWYQSKMHGNVGATGHQPGEPDDWSQCQHGSWFFLPWHRMYLLQFEAIIADATGTPDFALPYWDYPNAREAEIPAPFLDRNSPLFDATRHFRSMVLPAQTWPNAGTFVALGGGERRTPQHTGEVPGALELNPHNPVHGRVGGDMADFQSPLDPLFWIHHCNVDRLWEVWLGRPGRANPTKRDWVNRSFTFPNPGRPKRKKWRISEIGRTADAGYKYDDVSLVPSHLELAPSVNGVGEEAAPAPRKDDKLELLSATASGASVRDEVEITRAAEFEESAAVASETPLYLRLENVGIDGGNASDMWNVFLQVGGGERHLVGTIAPFGLAGLTASGGRQTLTFDITHLAGEVLGDAGPLRVTFEAAHEQVEAEPFWERAGLYRASE